MGGRCNDYRVVVLFQAAELAGKSGAFLGARSAPDLSGRRWRVQAAGGEALPAGGRI